jgi:hypothetical protein
MTPEEMQKALDAGSDMLRKMMDQANAAADQLCRDGDNASSADVRELAAALTYAHALGRRLNIGGIVARGGGK